MLQLIRLGEYKIMGTPFSFDFGLGTSPEEEEEERRRREAMFAPAVSPEVDQLLAPEPESEVLTAPTIVEPGGPSPLDDLLHGQCNEDGEHDQLQDPDPRSMPSEHGGPDHAHAKKQKYSLA